MRRPIPLEAGCREDHASCGPVRARTTQILCPTARLVAAAFIVLFSTAFSAAAQRAGTPDPSAVAQAVEAYFASLPDYQPGDLITRSQIERVLTMLDDAGAEVPNANDLAERGLSDSSFIVKELSTSSGKHFMRKLARKPGTFAHLDRLSTIPRGEKLVRDLIRDKDGDKMIEYLATTKGGRNMGGMMAGVRGGTDLNKPTDRIYTVADLVTALKAAFASSR
jgi:hypothetical protein